MSDQKWDAAVSKRLLEVALAEGLAISVEQAGVIVALLRSAEPLSHARLRYAICTHRPPGSSALYERISFLRRMFGQDFIAGFKTAAERQMPRARGGWRLGTVTYSLSPQAIEVCSRALERVGAKLILRPIEPATVEGAQALGEDAAQR